MPIFIMNYKNRFTLTVPLDALEAGERHVLGERRELIHILSASRKRKWFSVKYLM